jgi:hypothetical protein
MAGGAGPLTMGAGEVGVDAPTARELLEEVHSRITREEIGEIVALLERKSRGFRVRLGPEVIGAADETTLRDVLRSIFVSRRRVGAIFGVRPAEEVRDMVAELLHGDAAMGQRLASFCRQVDLPELAAAELGGELLHFYDPEQRWLCSRFVYNIDTRTGALPLLVDEDYELQGDGLGESYERIGAAIRSLDASAEASSFRPHGGGALATDVFLACVYGVYMNTVLGLKMSQEFNSLIPPLPQLARRLLGVHKMEV